MTVFNFDVAIVLNIDGQREFKRDGVYQLQNLLRKVLLCAYVFRQLLSAFDLGVVYAVRQVVVFGPFRWHSFELTCLPIFGDFDASGEEDGFA